MNSRFRLLLPVAAFALALAFLGFLLFGGPLREPAQQAGLSSQTGQKVDVGGPFSLTRSDGQNVQEADFRGRLMLVYFGFTYCPDICPTELQVISTALDFLKDEAERVAPLFISVDPERDTPAVMASYLSHFHPRIIGLTGSPESIAKAAGEYRVYYRKIEEEDASTPYTVDHLSIVYLMDGQGQYLRHFTHGTKPQDIAKAISEALAEKKDR